MSNLIILTTFLLSSVALADQTTSVDTKTGRRKVFVSFEEDLVEGSVTGSELFLIMQKKQSRFDRLFDLRDDFDDEMMNDAAKIE